MTNLYNDNLKASQLIWQRYNSQMNETIIRNGNIKVINVILTLWFEAVEATLKYAPLPKEDVKK